MVQILKDVTTTQKRKVNIFIRISEIGLIEGVKVDSSTPLCSGEKIEKLVLPECTDRGTEIVGIKIDAFSNKNDIAVDEIAIPDYFTIEEGSFRNADIRKVVWPSSALSIPNCCFQYSNVEEVENIANIKKIGAKAFYECKKLTSINIPSIVSCIEERAFTACGLKSFIWPEKCSVIPSDCFFCCRDLTNITFPKAIKYIEIKKSAFLCCPVHKLDLSSLTYCKIDEDFDETDYDKEDLIQQISYPFYM